MPQTPHIERHFTGSEMVRDIVIGMSDGLTVPFALAAGLSGAVDSTSIIVTAGLAEIAAGSIAMGPGGYMAGKSDVEHYISETAREEAEVRDKGDSGAPPLRSAGQNGAHRRTSGSRSIHDSASHFVRAGPRRIGMDKFGVTARCGPRLLDFRNFQPCDSSPLILPRMRILEQSKYLESTRYKFASDFLIE